MSRHNDAKSQRSGSYHPNAYVQSGSSSTFTIIPSSGDSSTNFSSNAPTPASVSSVLTPLANRERNIHASSSLRSAHMPPQSEALPEDGLDLDVEPPYEELEEEPETEASGDDIVVAVARPNMQQSIGIAYYNQASATVFVGEVDNYYNLQMTLQQLAPVLIVTHARAGEALFEAVCVDNIPVKTTKKSEFSADHAQHHLRQVFSEDEHAQSLGWTSRVDYSKPTPMMALAGLLAHLTSVRDAVRITQVKPSSATKVLLCDTLTRHALSVFVSDTHPGGGSRNKEGLSLLSLLNHAHTGPGRNLVKAWVRFPSTDAQLLADRLDHVEYLAQHVDFMIDLRSLLKRLRDVPRLLARFAALSVRHTDWVALVQSLQSIVRLHAAVAAHAATLPVGHGPPRALAALLRAFTPGVVEASLNLSAVIDEASTLATQRVRVNSGVDARLDEARRVFDALHDTMAQVLAEDLLSGHVPRTPRNMSYCFLQHIGYLLAVECDENEDPPVLPGLELQFRNARQVFYTNARTAQMDVELGDVLTAMAEAERQTSEAAIEAALHARADMEACAHACYELDALCSLAVAAQDLNMTRPVITRENILRIVDGKHPLLDVCNQEHTVANTVRLDDNNGKVNIITGPNNSGKSILLQTVGMITYMAHVGSFVPAASAVVGICDSIMTRVTTADNVNNGMSTFTSDVAHMGLMLHNAKPTSLLLVDEFGAGTNNYDGIALCAAVIRWLDLQGAKCPKGLVTTHFHEIYTYNLVRESIRVRFFSMQCVPVDPASEQNVGANNMSLDAIRALQGVTCVYKCVPGWGANSYGLGCALGAGVPVSVVCRALEISRSFKRREPVAPLKEATAVSQVNKHRELLHEVFTLGRELYLKRDEDLLLDKVQAFMDMLNTGGRVKNEVKR